jgi:glycolate oxidase
MTNGYDPALDDPLPAVDVPGLLYRLRQLLPADCVLAETEQLRPFECDALPTIHALPLVTVLPATVEQVQAVVRLCAELGVPVVSRGAGTGLSCGATPCPGGVLLVLSRLNRIIDIDPLARTARVQPGVRNLAISDAAAAHGLYYAPDPSSQLACSIGGNIAENSGGVHCLKYGLTVNNVLALRVIDSKGDMLEIDGEAAGPDLLAAMVGSEGLLGVVVEVTVRLLVTPPEVATLLVAFDDIAAASRAVADIIAAGVIPAGLEMMDQLSLRAAEDFVHAGYPRDAAAMLLIELDGCASEVAAEVAQVRDTLRAAGATEVREARDASERELFWKGRKNAFPAVARILPDYYCMDGTIPRAAIGEVLEYIGERSRHYDMPVANVFHAGDGNLHPLILFDGNLPGAIGQAEAFGADILEKCLSVGGTITGEHGVGLEKINQMASQFSDAELEQFRRLKQAFDPAGLLNPGKLIPTLRRCQEYRSIRQRGDA